MVDTTDRDAVTRIVHRLLVRRSFKDRLKVTGQDGVRPITVALRTDTIDALAVEVQKIGGQANVAVPLLDGLVVFSMYLEHGSARTVDDAQPLKADCTVGLLIERLIDDGGLATYIVNNHPVARLDPTSSARAEDARLLSID